MLKITVIESRIARRLIFKGRLIAPYTAELRTACEQAKADLQERELIIDLNNISAISQEGEAVLLELMNERTSEISLWRV